MEKAYLILENGRIFEGERFGARADAMGEMVFTTGMCACLETLTDPGYAGQIVLSTFPLIGNYGRIDEDVKGKMHLAGYVVREACDAPSNFRSQGTLESLLEENGIPGIKGVDTREITLILRNAGTMNAMIASEIPKNFDSLRAHSAKNTVRETGAEKTEVLTKIEGAKHVVLWDFGARPDFVSYLTEKGVSVTRAKWSITCDEILALSPDGVVLSDGPGDPNENEGAISEIAKLMGRVPVFGTGLSHQMMALAMGARCEKMPFGHRGANQPVRDRKTGRTVITAQNHGYCVVSASLPAGAVVRLENANDRTVEGIEYDALRAFSVQFQPESLAGFGDEEFLLGRFLHMMGV